VKNQFQVHFEKETRNKYQSYNYVETKFGEIIEATRNQMEEMKPNVEATERHCKELETLRKGHIELEEEVQDLPNIYRQERREFKIEENVLRRQVGKLEKKISKYQLNQTGTDEEKLHRKFNDLQTEECDVEERRDPCEIMRYVFNTPELANEIWIFVFVVYIHALCEIFGFSNFTN